MTNLTFTLERTPERLAECGGTRRVSVCSVLLLSLARLYGVRALDYFTQLAANTVSHSINLVAAALKVGMPQYTRPHVHNL